MVNEIVSLIAVSSVLLSVYSDATDFWILILYISTLPNSWMGSRSCLVTSLGFSVYSIMCVCMHAKSLQLCPTLCDPVDCSQAPLSLGFSRQEYWSGSLCPPPGELPDPCIEDVSRKSPALAGGFFTTSAIWEAPYSIIQVLNVDKEESDS